MNIKKVTIGIIKGAHALKGELKFVPFLSDYTQYKKLEKISLVCRNIEKSVEIESIRAGTKSPIIKFVGFDSIESVEELKGWEMVAPSSWIAPAPKGEHYIFDLIGMSVKIEGNSFFSGVLTDIFPTGANDVYVIEEGNSEYLIPATREVIIKIDTEKKEMIIKPLEGMID